MGPELSSTYGKIQITGVLVIESLVIIDMLYPIFHMLVQYICIRNATQILIQSLGKYLI